MDLCSQHEILLEERNQELNTLETQVRYVYMSLHEYLSSSQGLNPGMCVIEFG